MGLFNFGAHCLKCKQYTDTKILPPLGKKLVLSVVDA